MSELTIRQVNPEEMLEAVYDRLDRGGLPYASAIYSVLGTRERGGWRARAVGSRFTIVAKPTAS